MRNIWFDIYINKRYIFIIDLEKLTCKDYLY
jgi:hypothetical protein